MDILESEKLLDGDFRELTADTRQMHRNFVTLRMKHDAGPRQIRIPCSEPPQLSVLESQRTSELLSCCSARFPMSAMSIAMQQQLAENPTFP